MLSTSRREEDGSWTFVTRGIMEEFVKRALTLGDHVCTKRGQGNWQPTVDPEAAKFLMDEMATEAGVEVFFHSWGVDVIQDGNKVLGVVFDSKQGRQAILAKQVVDCSGDADILFRAGGDYRQITHGIGHVVRLANMDRITGKSAPLDVNGKCKWGYPMRGNEANPSTRWINSRQPPLDRPANGLDVRELSKAEREFRRFWWKHVSEMRKTPGWEQVYIANTCSQIGPRATRLVDAELVMDRALIAAGTDFADPIGWFGVDGAHAAFKVAFRCLVPKRVDNLLCAGRCLGAGDTIDTFRLIAPCFVMGQAAGIAAALAAQKDLFPRALPYAVLRRELTRQNVFIDG